MAKLDPKKFAKESYTDIPEDVPAQFGEGSAPAPYPGKYGFQLPENIEDAWEKYEPTINDKKVERISCVFDDSHPLTILKTPTGEEHNAGNTLSVRISNAERARDKEKTKLVSDMYYLLTDGLGVEDTEIRTALKAAKDKKQNANLVVWAPLMNKQAGATFGGRIVWSAYCNPKNTRYISDEKGNNVKDPDDTKGCGKRIYQRDIPKGQDTEDQTTYGRYLERFPCPDCEAALRAFPQVEGFSRWSPEEAGAGEAAAG